MLRRVLVLASSLAALFMGGACWSQNYPDRPVRVIVGFGAGAFVTGVD